MNTAYKKLIISRTVESGFSILLDSGEKIVIKKLGQGKYLIATPGYLEINRLSQKDIADLIGKDKNE